MGSLEGSAYGISNHRILRKGIVCRKDKLNPLKGSGPPFPSPVYVRDRSNPGGEGLSRGEASSFFSLVKIHTHN